MSSYSLPSSPESVSDEDNHPKALPWYEAEWPEAELDVLPIVLPVDDSPDRERSPTPPFVHRPVPSTTTKTSDISPKTNFRLKRLERLEKKELKAMEKKEAKEDAKAFRASIKRSRERQEERMRAENRSARIKQEMEIRAAEWRK